MHSIRRSSEVEDPQGALDDLPFDRERLPVLNPRK